jgi:hypothetical protein
LLPLAALECDECLQILLDPLRQAALCFHRIGVARVRVHYFALRVPFWIIKLGDGLAPKSFGGSDLNNISATGSIARTHLGGFQWRNRSIILG